MLYHLSDENHNGEVFSPRVPLSTAFVLNDEIVEDVHVPYRKNIKFYRPTEEEVFDCKFTNEVWVRRKVKMKCIGKIRAKYDYNMCSRQYRPNVKIKWIEKYETD